MTVHPIGDGVTPPPISSPPTLFFLSGADISVFSPISLPIYKTIFHAAAAASVFCFLSPEPSLLQRTCTAHFAFFTFKVMLQHSTLHHNTQRHITQDGTTQEGQKSQRTEKYERPHHTLQRK